jgi:hypothetical protein
MTRPIRYRRPTPPSLPWWARGTKEKHPDHSRREGIRYMRKVAGLRTALTPTHEQKEVFDRLLKENL